MSRTATIDTPHWGSAAGPCRPPLDLATAWRLMAGGRHGHEPHHGPGPGGPRGGGGGMGGPGFPFGWGPWGGGGRRRGPKARRGDVRTATLLLLAEEPRNGYQIMQELEERSDGAWRPSAGSVYPALQLLEDEGLVRSEESDGRKLLHLTDAGRKLVEERGEDQPAPWEQLAGDVGDDVRAIVNTMRQIGFALHQIMQTGSDRQREQLRRTLATTRQELYKILAEDDAAATGGEDA